MYSDFESEEVICCGRKLHNEDHLNSYSSQNVD
jgi:hypothetical protein